MECILEMYTFQVTFKSRMPNIQSSIIGKSLKTIKEKGYRIHRENKKLVKFTTEASSFIQETIIGIELPSKDTLQRTKYEK